MGAAHTTKITGKMENSQTSSPLEKTEGQPRVSSSTRPLAIEGPPTVTNNESHVNKVLPNQPRQPTNLQGLLRFAIETTNFQENASNTQFQPMDKEREMFLKTALSSLSCNIIKELEKAIKILSYELKPDDDISEQETALQRIADVVDNIDIANDFYKIGGFSIFSPCLHSPHSSIRWRTADVIAELTQNNPFWQEKCLENGLLPTLINMVDTDPTDAVRIKALYAVSCIVREHPASLKFMNREDYSILLRAMQSSVKKLQIKSAFLLSSICTIENIDDLKLTLVKMGLIEQAAGLLATNDLLPEIRDQLINVLNGLTNNDFLPALKECQRPELGLHSTLEHCMKNLEQEENLDQVDVCRRLLEKVFSD